MSKAQNADQYGFTATSGTFTSILGQAGVGTIPTIHQDDGISNGIVPFQFSFNFCGVNYTGFKVCSNGWVNFSNSTSSTSFSNGLTDLPLIKPALMPLWDNLSGASNLGATALFITTGTAPNRVFTYECNNWGWNNNAVSATISFQIKLYETTNYIQFIYRQEAGSVSVPASATIGICDNNTASTYLTLNNATSTPTASGSVFTTSINTRPATGQIYEFTPPPPCNGVPPVAVISPAGPISICLGANVVLNSLLSPPATGVTYQWESSPTNSAPWTPLPNATLSAATVTPGAGTTYYHLVTTCTASGQTNTSASVAISTAPPTYATVPYFQDFENWTNYCDYSDVPSGSSTNWKGTPATSDSAWRRDDMGNTANWAIPWGSYTPASVSGMHSARFSSASVSNSSFATPISGHLDLFLDCSGQAGDKQAYFYFINQTFGWFSYDSLKVSLSTDGGITFNQIGIFDSADNWKKVSVPIASSSNQTLLRFTGLVTPSFDFSDIGIDSLYIAPPCSGAPAAGSLPVSIAGCAGNSYVLAPSGTTMAGNQTFEWQESLNGGTVWTTIPGATSQNYTTNALYNPASYRMIITCQTSLLKDTTNIVTIQVNAPVYATVPYMESFENWINGCDTVDLPSVNWINTPSTGDASWRREDAGGTAWTFLGGDYTPAARHLDHSARFHSWNTTTTGNLDLFMDCSSVAGTKELQFYYINPSSFQDSLRVMISTNGGSSFTTLASYGDQATWGFKMIPITSLSNQTIIRFQGLGDWSDDIGIDKVQVVPPCSGAPVAGTVDSVKVCAGQNFDLSLSGTSASGGLTYQWQSSPDNSTWANVINGNVPIATITILTPTYFRAIVTCSNSGISDTSVSRFFGIAPFYLCYCSNSALNNASEDIGNVTLTRSSPIQQTLNNGTATPLTNNPNSVNVYTDYTGLAPATIYKGENYNYKITAITQDAFFWGTNVAVYIDMNHDGIFDPGTERVTMGTFNSITQVYAGNYSLPLTALSGITGMRVVQDFSPDPCFQPWTGEVEDYLVNIDYPVCNGAMNAGTPVISDTLLCVNTPFMVFDTSHEKQLSGIDWNWQSSTDSINWMDIPGSQKQDTLWATTPMTQTFYRLKMICTANNVYSYSAAVLIKAIAPYLCYCKSYADGGNADLSDIGAFSIGNYIVNGGGPHLSNVGAVHAYSVNDNVINLYRDSSYAVAAYHIIRDANQQDAKVTLFIDFDNDFVYDIPDERVWTGFTDASNIFINTSVFIPATAVKNVYTGMRWILNNDVNPNIPSDEACGTYTSGETEDCIVMIRDKNDPPPTIVQNVNGITEASVFPNPSDGRLNVRLLASSPVEKTGITVTNLTGQKIFQQSFTPRAKVFETEIDISRQAAGMYFVEIQLDEGIIVKKIIIK